MSVLERARAAASGVLDPELPVLTLDDLGVLRDVRLADDGAVEVDITPTYSGCPAMDAIRADVEEAVRAAGAPRVRVRTVLSPAWSTDWISAAGRRALLEHGVAPPGPARQEGPVVVSLGRRTVACPQCGSPDTEELARFSSTACKELRRCRACREPFDAVKPL